ncbi:hypothetical protein [Leisingera sp.]|uniref:hypothetical protein n=1 Tax=Leisingera sp. TaxID=1879318 RepID=UPI002B2787A4|nr:hypothetical protein [Leisingera sp.]
MLFDGTRKVPGTCFLPLGDGLYPGPNAFMRKSRPDGPGCGGSVPAELGGSATNFFPVAVRGWEKVVMAVK